MPARFFRKKRNFRRNYRKRGGKVAYRQKIPRVPFNMRPKIIRFKRDIEETLALSGSVAPDGWNLDGTNRVYKSLGWSLGSLPDSVDFSALFRQYRIKGARMRMYFSNTVSGTEDGSLHANSQILVRMAPNQRGTNDLLGNSYWQQIEAKKYKLAINGGKPLDIYFPLKQAMEVTTSTGTGNVLKRPGFVTTQQGNVVHYGLNMAMERVDGAGFTSGFGNTQKVKIITTLYLECRGVS